MVAPQSGLLGLTAVLFLSLPSMPLRAAGPSKAPPATNSDTSLLKARVALAQKAYDGALERFRESKRIDNRVFLGERPEELYKWSVRLLHAQQALATKQADQATALQAHLKRMTELDKHVKLLIKDKVLGPHADLDADWYRLEAAYWLNKAKAR